MISKKKVKIVSYLVVVGSLFTLLAIFYDPLGPIQVIQILLNVSLCVALYWLFKSFSNQGSLHAKIRTFYGTSHKLIVSFVNENSEVFESKRIWKYETIFFVKLGLGFLFMFALVSPLTYILTLVHELSHALPALFYGAQINEIAILGVGEGFVKFSILTSDNNLSIIYLAGSLGSMLFGVVFLIIISRNKHLKLDLLFPIYIVIGFDMISNVIYWYYGILLEMGDSWYFLTLSPHINPLWLANLCCIIFFGLVGYLLIFLVAKIAFRLEVFLKHYIPDLSDLNSTIFPLIQSR